MLELLEVVEVVEVLRLWWGALKEAESLVGRMDKQEVDPRKGR